MAQEYQQRGGGIPDLFLWNHEKKCFSPETLHNLNQVI
jgi:hypothetical protein